MSAPRRKTMTRGNLARTRAERRKCPSCGRKAALVTVANPGTVSLACRWDDCDYESTTVLDSLTNY